MCPHDYVPICLCLLRVCMPAYFFHFMCLMSICLGLLRAFLFSLPTSYVPFCFTCLLAQLVLSFTCPRACVSFYLRYLLPYVPLCFICLLCAYLPLSFTCLYAFVPLCFTRLSASGFYVSMCLHAFFNVPMCLGAFVFYMSMCPGAVIFCVPTCLRTFLFYVPTCLCTCVLSAHMPVYLCL